MRFLLDVNVGSRIALVLAEAGHDVVRAIDIDPKAEDTAILDLAVRDDRIIITYDRDFSELVFARKAAVPPAIIYIRFPPRDIVGATERLLTVLDFAFLDGHITVVDAKRVRRSPFPIGQNDND